MLALLARMSTAKTMAEATRRSTTQTVAESRAPDGTRDSDGPRLQAVLWDLDGTLLDSEKLWDISLEELAASIGGVLSARAREAMVGTNMATSMDILYTDLGITDLAAAGRDSDTDAAWLDRRTGELFAAGLTWRPGARDLLLAVRRAGLRTALVTSTSGPLVDQVLHTIGAENFDAVVCGGETAAKPDAAPYRRALAQLRVDPAATLVIEDSPTGVAAGLAAGCRVLAVPVAATVAPAPGVVVRDTLAGLTVDDLREIWGWPNPP